MPVSSLSSPSSSSSSTLFSSRGFPESLTDVSTSQKGNLGTELMAVSHSSHSSSSPPTPTSESRAIKLALELALLDVHPPGNSSSSSSATGVPNGSLLNSLSDYSSLLVSSLGSNEDLKIRRSQNMTECVPVPSSEHVAEIVGRQGCKIKALRAKTSTYIKTPVRGDEPVFVVTGRKEDVGLAKREILSAADHFSQIRASRKNQINSTLSFGQMVANAPGQKTAQVRVPYRVVGLVVGPKGATIKRIQQTTHTYIVTPSRDKEPVFEVTGMPENVEAARKEIEAHIALRTRNDLDILNGVPTSSSSSSGGAGGDLDSLFFSCDGVLLPRFHGSSSPHNSSSILTNGSFTASLSNKTLQHLLDEQQGQSHGQGQSSSNGIIIHGQRSHPPATSVWSNGADSHDSGIGHSPPFVDTPLGPGLSLHHHHQQTEDLKFSGSSSNGIHNTGNGGNVNGNSGSGGSGGGIWGELNKVLGGLDYHSNAVADSSRNSVFHHHLGSRSFGLAAAAAPPSSASSPSSSQGGGHRHSLDLGTSSLPSYTANSTISSSSEVILPDDSFKSAENYSCSPMSSSSLLRPFSSSLSNGEPLKNQANTTNNPGDYLSY